MADVSEIGGGRNDEFKSAEEYRAFDVEVQKAVDFPTKIERSDIQAHPIGVGETEIIAQRHGAYIRDKEDPNRGSLSPESAAAEKAAAATYFENFLSQLPESERDTVDILFVASDTGYLQGGKRSYETATLAQQAATQVLEQHGLSADHILNTRGKLDGDGGPKPMAKLREPNMLNESPEFLDFMLKEYGAVNLDFWIAFEEDHHKDVREAMGAEGPDDIADRTEFALSALDRYASIYHKSNPGRRLIVWAATHYDTISPFVKRDVFGISKDRQLMVDYGAGITIDVDESGHATTELGGKSYDVPLRRHRDRPVSPEN